MAKKYHVTLSEEERATLHTVTHKGKVAARTLARAHILLQAAEGRTDAEIAAALHVGVATVERTRRRYVEEGVEKALTERPRPGAPRLLSGTQEAYLVALACSDPPAGHTCWNMRLLADKMVAVEVVPFISADTVGRTLKSRRSNPGW
jgi:transposase